MVFLFICFSCFSFFHQTDVEGMEQIGRFFVTSQYGGRTEGASILTAVSPAKPNCRVRECTYVCWNEHFVNLLDTLVKQMDIKEFVIFDVSYYCYFVFDFYKSSMMQNQDWNGYFNQLVSFLNRTTNNNDSNQSENLAFSIHESDEEGDVPRFAFVLSNPPPKPKYVCGVPYGCDLQ